MNTLRLYALLLAFIGGVAHGAEDRGVGMDATRACSELGRLERMAPSKRPSGAELRITEISERYRLSGQDLIAISQRSVAIGMNECGVIAALGRPASSNTTTTRGGTRKQFVYGGRFYVYADNGAVTGWQQF